MRSVVTAARQCLIEHTHDCQDDVASEFQSHLGAVLTFHSSLTSHCVDIYYCLAKFSWLGRKILSKVGAPEPNWSSSSSGSSGSSESNSNEDSGSLESDGTESGGASSQNANGKGKKTGHDKGSKSTGKKTDNGSSDRSGKGSGSRESAEDIDSDLRSLCQRITEQWECVRKGLDRLSPQQLKLLMHILEPLWTIVSDKCSDSGE